MLLRRRKKSPEVLLPPAARLHAGPRSTRSGDRCYRQVKDIWEKSATSTESHADAPRSAFVYDGGRRAWDVRRRGREVTRQRLSLVALQDVSSFQTRLFSFPVTDSELNQPADSSALTTPALSKTAISMRDEYKIHAAIGSSREREREREKEGEKEGGSRGFRERRDGRDVTERTDSNVIRRIDRRSDDGRKEGWMDVKKQKEEKERKIKTQITRNPQKRREKGGIIQRRN